MPKNILYDLYNGKFNAWERRSIRTLESMEVSRKIDDETRHFAQKMSLDDFQRFQNLEGLYLRSSDFEQADAFSYGFRLGTKLMCAVFLDENELSKA